MDEKIVYIYSKNLIMECNRLPTMLNRASMVQDLINSYKLLSTEKFLVVQSLDATEDELKLFHSSGYINFLKKINDLDDFDEFEEEQLEYGLGYDCPILERNLELVKTLAGGSVTAAKLLARNKCKVAINWFGGWHHAQRDTAEGFCYVNDIVIAIQTLTRTFDKILYLDLDIHHGDGVQNAFEFSNKILTVSFHKKSPGFYPGTGDLKDVGSSKGKYYSINVPLLEGVGNDNYLRLFNQVFNSVLPSFKPKCIVVQCGADGLNGDPIGQCNLTLKTIGECINKVLKTNIPTLFLGGDITLFGTIRCIKREKNYLNTVQLFSTDVSDNSVAVCQQTSNETGGYNFANTARLWAYLTSIIAGKDLDDDIPDTCENFVKYGPTYELHIDGSLQKDLNTNHYINNIISEIATYCSFVE